MIASGLSSMSMSLFLLYMSSRVSSFKIPHISDIVWYVFLFLTSLSMIISMSIYVAVYSIISFFFIANIPLYVSTTSLSIQRTFRLLSSMPGFLILPLLPKQKNLAPPTAFDNSWQQFHLWSYSGRKFYSHLDYSIFSQTTYPIHQPVMLAPP